MSKKYLIALLFPIFVFSHCSTNKEIRINSLKYDFTGKTLKSSLGDCIVVFDDIDKLTGKRITELKEDRIFTYTHDKLKKYFADRPFIQGFGALSKTSDGLFFLNLSFVIDTKYIKTGYNGIPVQSMLRITLINGETVFLENILNDQGIRDTKKNKITYQAIFPIKKGDLKLLKKNELDKIGVLWNGGFEEYDIYNIDFIMKQYECLKSLD